MEKLILLVILLVSQFLVQAQVSPAPVDKAVVYFVRPSGFASVVNFTYFDSTKVIGQFNGLRVLRYECEPREHLFWVKSENSDFVKADLKAGKIYVIDVIPITGRLRARVNLVPINSGDYKMKRIQKLLNRTESESFSKRDLNSLQKKMEDTIKQSLAEAKKLDGDIKKLTGFTFLPEQLKYIKKKKQK